MGEINRRALSGRARWARGPADGATGECSVASFEAPHVFSGSFILSYLFVAHAGAFLYTAAQGRCRTHCPGYKIAHERRETWRTLSFGACTQQQRMTPKALLRRRRSPSLLSTCNGRQTQSPPMCLCCCQFTGAGAAGGGGAACAKCASHVQEENERLEKPAGSGADFSSPRASVADERRIERREKGSGSGAGARRGARGGCSAVTAATAAAAAAATVAAAGRDFTSVFENFLVRDIVYLARGSRVKEEPAEYQQQQQLVQPSSA
ncbi:unnamed protein product [Trichogramma brassicae]|uniref:Uncharacterized protein n=1 Tax=Trichogramma brassicae TaxID=86971 RepID=A0A6H5I9V1_9HYME|nr:unnamed protein product [Trichogramma brassicae]